MSSLTWWLDFSYICFLNQKCNCRLKELKEARIWLQFSQTWEGNICTERKGCLPEVHSSVLCPEVLHNGINPKNLIIRKELKWEELGVARSNWSHLLFGAFMIDDCFRVWLGILVPFFHYPFNPYDFSTQVSPHLGFIL